MPLPTYPPVDLRELSDEELSTLADYFATAHQVARAEVTRRSDTFATVRRAAAYRIALGGPALHWWTPQPWHGARIIAGDRAGRRGFIVGECEDGCRRAGEAPRYRLLTSVHNVLTICIPRAWLAPLPTFKGKGNRIL